MVLLRHAACTRAFFFFNDTATTEIYTLSLHDALPILRRHASRLLRLATAPRECPLGAGPGATVAHSATLPAAPRHLRQSARSEEHTSELQSQSNLVCRLLLEKKKNNLTSHMEVQTATN